MIYDDNITQMSGNSSELAEACYALPECLAFSLSPEGEYGFLKNASFITEDARTEESAGAHGWCFYVQTYYEEGAGRCAVTATRPARCGDG